MTRGTRDPVTVDGFTLLEMLVILAILSLVAGIVFPSVDKAMRRQAFADSRTRVEFGLRAARAVAIRTGVPVRFVALPGRRGFAYGPVAEALPATTAVSLPDKGVAFFADGSAIGGDVLVEDRGLRERWNIRGATGAIERVR